MIEDVDALRDAIIKRLEGTPGLQPLGTRLYGEAVPPNPTWPFLRYGVPILTPADMSGATGARHRITLHVFAKGPSMDACNAYSGAVVRSLDGEDLPLAGLPNGRQATAYELYLAGHQVVPDGAKDWHGILEFDVAVAGA